MSCQPGSAVALSSVQTIPLAAGRTSVTATPVTPACVLFASKRWKPIAVPGLTVAASGFMLRPTCLPGVGVGDGLGVGVICGVGVGEAVGDGLGVAVGVGLGVT